MLFFTKKIRISKHCYERFSKRVGNAQGKKIYKTNSAIRKQVLYDFQVRNILYKEPAKNGVFRVFTKGARIYVIQETPKTLVIKTVIQQTVSQAKEFKNNMRKSL